MSFLQNILALLPDNISKKIKPVDLRTSFEYVYEDHARIDASNLQGQNLEAWRGKLGVKADSFHTGPISTTANSVQLALSPDGTNSVTIAGTTLSKTTPDSFPYTPVSPGKLKALVLYAKATAQIFYLAEGVQGDEAVSPDFEGLFIASITVSDGGQIVNPAGPQDFLYQSNDAWITQQITGSESLLVAGNNPGNTFDISVKTGTANPGIAGITAEAKLFWEGRIFWLRNNSAVDVALTDAPVTGELTRFSIVQFEKPTLLKKAGWAAVKVKQGVLVVIGLGGGASFPEGGQPGDVLQHDLEGAAWTNRLTLAEQEIDAEVVNRAAADLQLQQNINAEQQARINALLTKLDKPLTDGTWLVKKAGNAITYEDASGLFVHQITITTSTNITTNTLEATTNRKQHGRNVKINNGVSAITITCEASSDADFIASYTKVGSAEIKFVEGVGVSLVKVDDRDSINGVRGSTAALTRSGNTYYLQISNR